MNTCEIARNVVLAESAKERERSDAEDELPMIVAFSVGVPSAIYGYLLDFVVHGSADGVVKAPKVLETRIGTGPDFHSFRCTTKLITCFPLVNARFSSVIELLLDTYSKSHD